MNWGREPPARWEPGPMRQYIDRRASLESTVPQIAEPIEEAWTAGQVDSRAGVESRLWDLWYHVLDLARDDVDDSYAPRLLGFLQALKTRREPEQPAGNSMIQENWVYKAGSLWSGLNVFGPAVREVYSSAMPARTPPDKLSEETRRWKNLNAFLARLTAAEVANFDLYAIWAQRSALESDKLTAPELDISVPAAAAWIKHAGQTLYTSTKTWPDNIRGGGNPAQGGELWKGVPGFDKERWQLWKRRYLSISEDSSVNGETKQAAKYAVDAMNALEENST